MSKESDYEKVKNILEKEVVGLKQCFQRLEENNTYLKTELEKISGNIEEDYEIIKDAKNYVKYSEFSEQDTTRKVVYEKKMLYHDLKLLHQQLCNKTKVFSVKYFSLSEDVSPPQSLIQNPEDCLTSDSETFPPNENNAGSNDNVSRTRSVLDILNELTNNFSKRLDEEYGEIHISSTDECPHLEFLLSAGIVIRTSGNPSCIKLAVQKYDGINLF